MDIPVLFVHSRSNYKKLRGFDCYDEKRNALTYNGVAPVIAHPPCRTFSRLKGLTKASQDEKQLAYWAVNLVRENGGIVEHPYDSDLWKDVHTPEENVIDEYGGFTVVIEQKDFGFYLKKKTRLYIVGCSPEDLPPYADYGDSVNRSFSSLTEKQRSETTIALCKWLAQIMHIIDSQGHFLSL